MTGEAKVQEIIAAYRQTINSTPALLSILYDADLLPEQLVSVRSAISMAAVVEAWEAGRASVATDLAPHTLREINEADTDRGQA
ncbi:hypothetical protein [Paracoccus sp. (in: a-proteobacteria)]|uniref:hypothetical protein n=1 Tax=Paracoccus sp. TaxID=267 RepID=UPI00289B8BF2|nr:hypothetical protein [Paracoccus sp. (in: a-proteobacteria)]